VSKVSSNFPKDTQRPENEHHIKEVEKGENAKNAKNCWQHFFQKSRFCTSVAVVDDVFGQQMCFHFSLIKDVLETLF
jgi:hypothetical protein